MFPSAISTRAELRHLPPCGLPSLPHSNSLVDLFVLAIRQRLEASPNSLSTLRDAATLWRFFIAKRLAAGRTFVASYELYSLANAMRQRLGNIERSNCRYWRALTFRTNMKEYKRGKQDKWSRRKQKSHWNPQLKRLNRRKDPELERFANDGKLSCVLK